MLLDDDTLDVSPALMNLHFLPSLWENILTLLSFTNIINPVGYYTSIIYC